MLFWCLRDIFCYYYYYILKTVVLQNIEHSVTLCFFFTGISDPAVPPDALVHQVEPTAPPLRAPLSFSLHHLLPSSCPLSAPKNTPA